MPDALRRELSAVHPLAGLALGALTWGHVAACFAIFLLCPNPWRYVILPALVIYQARNQNALGILVHEAIHGVLTPDAAMGERAARWLFGAPILLGFGAYRQLHLAHHQHLYTEKDPDLPLYEGFPLENRRFLRRVLGDFLGGQSFKKYLVAMSGGAGQWKLPVADIWAIVTVQGGCLAAVAVNSWWEPWLLLWVLPMGSLMPVLFRLRAALEHGGLKGTGVRTRSVASNVISRFLLWPLYINHHIEHHLYPWVPCYKLSRVRDWLLGSEDVPGASRCAGYLDGVRQLTRSAG